MKKEKTDWIGGLVSIGCLPFGVSVIFLFYCLFDVTNIYLDITYGEVDKLCQVFCAVLYVLIYLFSYRFVILRDNCKYAIKKAEEQSEKFQKELECKYEDEKKELLNSIREKEAEIQRRESNVKNFINSLDQEKYCAELISDFRTVNYEDAARWLLYKQYPAPTAAETVRSFREETKGYIKELQEYKYKERERIEKIKDNADRRVLIANIEKDKFRFIADFAEERMKSTMPFREVAELYADALAVAYGNIADELRERVRPANTTARIIESELRKKIREATYEAKQLQYRWNFLFSIMPELKDYVFEDSSLMSMAEYNNIEDFNDNRDRARDYLTEDEYNKLSIVEKYQLSLDRYKKRQRPNSWIAGVEYEMYCSYELRKNGFKVFENGINMRRADMGRDIIAYKDGATYIIQCKRYSALNKDGERKLVHENVICQLFGTTIEYQISNPDNTLFQNLNKVIPVLYTTGDLSDVAKKFAEHLKVRVIKCKMGDYPMIKCNINNNERIYHLPFDQQYWSTKIEHLGEMYCWTVEEAEKNGFRRARRWIEN